jgi:hypothetical protein
MEEQTPARVERRDGIRDRFWFQALAVVVIVGVLALVAIRLVHHDVVEDWLVLASCPAATGTAPATVSSSLDTSDCATAPTHSVSGRGWPIVPFVLPASAGLDPTITKVLSDPKVRTLSVEYDSQANATAGTGDGVVLVFIEIPAESVPGVTYTIEGASGPVTVTSATAS